MKRLLLIAMTAMAFNANADTVRTADGISCSFDSDDSPFEISVYGQNGTFDNDYSSKTGSTYNNSDENQVGVSLTYKFGGPKRLQCDKLYQLELRSKEARVKELEAKIQMLEAASTVTWN